jgi:hypothetical protein
MIKKLQSEKEKIQEEFGHQRAKMRELFVQKEGLDLFWSPAPLAKINIYSIFAVQWQKESEECAKLKEEMKKLESELGEVKSQLLAVGFQQETDLITEQQNCQSEIASLQQLIQGGTQYTLSCFY